jgi:hypothetical protein
VGQTTRAGFASTLSYDVLLCLISRPHTVKKPETFTLRIDPDLRKELQKIAEKQERPIGWIVRKAIENYIKENK